MDPLSAGVDVMVRVVVSASARVPVTVGSDSGGRRIRGDPPLVKVCDGRGGRGPGSEAPRGVRDTHRLITD